MPVFLNTKGQATLGIALCGRCQLKRRIGDLVTDGNVNGFMVCKPTISPGCWDEYDPMRMPARQVEKYTLPFYRPDEPVEIDPPRGLPPLEPPEEWKG